LLETDLALNMSLEDALRFLVHFKSFQPQGRECFAVSLFALGAFLLGVVDLSHISILPDLAES
jgi:hypothetical protein